MFASRTQLAGVPVIKAVALSASKDIRRLQFMRRHLQCSASVRVQWCECFRNVIHHPLIPGAIDNQWCGAHYEDGGVSPNRPLRFWDQTMAKSRVAGTMAADWIGGLTASPDGNRLALHIDGRLAHDRAVQMPI